nr:MAG TPA: hypothetical protein [Caudoviricetes sp.]
MSFVNGSCVTLIDIIVNISYLQKLFLQIICRYENLSVSLQCLKK